MKYKMMSIGTRKKQIHHTYISFISGTKPTEHITCKKTNTKERKTHTHTYNVSRKKKKLR